jgi:hypothetical protein
MIGVPGALDLVALADSLLAVQAQESRRKSLEAEPESSVSLKRSSSEFSSHSLP